MNIEIDLSPIINFINLPSDVLVYRVMFLFGWIPFAILFLWIAKEMWLNYIRGQWGSQQKFILLAIDVPRANIQTPKAVENIFTYLLGAHGTTTLVDDYWVGKFQLSFSFEIVSIDGYTQFLIRTPENFRNLVESAIYSQYPDSEITEVDDYTKDLPSSFPDDEWDCVGGEFLQAKNWVYPIKTYDSFVYQVGPSNEEYFKDPMASLMDLCSSLQTGEQLWYQIILIPEGFDWIEAGNEEIKKILKEKVPSKDNIVDKFTNFFVGTLANAGEAIYSIWGDIKETKVEKKDEALKMIDLKPKEKKQIEAIQNKISKLGFAFKSRFVYIARKEVKQVPKVLNGFVGYMKQFTDMDLNNMKPDAGRTFTSVPYFFKESRLNSLKNQIVNNYKNRDDGLGAPTTMMNVEELATLWHFPIESVVKAPMIQKSIGKKSIPPALLPMADQGKYEEKHFNSFNEEMEEVFRLKKDKKELDENIFVSEEDKDASVSSVQVDNEEDIDEIFKKSNEEEIDDNNEKNNIPSNLPFV